MVKAPPGTARERGGDMSNHEKVMSPHPVYDLQLKTIGDNVDEIKEDVKEIRKILSPPSP